MCPPSTKKYTCSDLASGLLRMDTDTGRARTLEPPRSCENEGQCGKEAKVDQK